MWKCKKKSSEDLLRQKKKSQAGFPEQFDKEGMGSCSKNSEESNHRPGAIIQNKNDCERPYAS